MLSVLCVSTSCFFIVCGALHFGALPDALLWDASGGAPRLAGAHNCRIR